jgi:predicted aconitase
MEAHSHLGMVSTVPHQVGAVERAMEVLVPIGLADEAERVFKTIESSIEGSMYVE